jgi:hypothetical protein
MKIHLSESQVKKLISDYKTINEQSVGFNPTTKTETVDFKSVWDSGMYRITPKQIQNLNNQMSVIRTFLRLNPQTKLTIQVEAGESRVTNYDNERGRIKVKPGYLSNMRGESLVGYLNSFFKNLKNEGISFTYPSIPKPKTIIGSTSYSQANGDNPKDPRYKEEQFVRLKITASSQSECLIGLEVLIGYIGTTVHKCDEALFELKMNGVSLGIANLNNGKYDVNGFTKDLVLSDPMLEVKKKIKEHNDKMYSKMVGAERRKFSKWRGSNPGTSYKEYVFDGKGIGDLTDIGDVPSYRTYVQQFYKKNNPLKVTYNDETIFTREMLNKIIEDRKGFSTIPKYEMSTYKRAVGKPFKFDKDQKNKSVKALHQKLTTLPGRTSDKKIGGKRTQTFTIDTAKAKEIFNQGKVKDNKIILSMKPLVSRSGPYSHYYGNGSHSDVPFVRITKDGESKHKYKGYPSVSVTRGSLKEVTLLQTDLCGNPITAKNQ